MVITISHINYPETHLPRFTPSLFCYLQINFPPFPSFLSLYSQHLPWSVFRSFPHKPVLYKLLCQHFSLPQQNPFTSHFISLPPSKISNSANIPPPPLPTFHLPPLLTFLLPKLTLRHYLLISSSPKFPLQHHYCTLLLPQQHSIFLYYIVYLLNFCSLKCFHHPLDCCIVVVDPLLPDYWGESASVVSWGFAASFSRQSSSRAATPKGSLHKSRADSVVGICGQLKRCCVVCS